MFHHEILPPQPPEQQDLYVHSTTSIELGFVSFESSLPEIGRFFYIGSIGELSSFHDTIVSLQLFIVTIVAIRQKKHNEHGCIPIKLY